MLKRKFINSFILSILLCSYSCISLANKDDIAYLTPIQQENYLTNSINAFFQVKRNCCTSDTANYIFSPFCLDVCLATFGNTLFSRTKQKFDNKLTSLGKNPNMSLASANQAKLQFLTTILTRDGVIPKVHNKFATLNIHLGEYLLQNTDNANILREDFKNNIQNILSQKFTGSLNLDYETLWSPAVSPEIYLKVASAMKFYDNWRDEPFDYYGLANFYMANNKTIETDFMEKTISGSPVIDDSSNWQAMRVFYEQQYAIDIILPAENNMPTEADKQHIIYSLIAKLNQNKINHRQETNLIMPKFEYKQQNTLSNYTVHNVLNDITPDYRGFLLDTDHNNLLDVTQQCYIKIDEKGTTAEAITEMCVADGASPYPMIQFLVNRSYFFVISEYVTGKKPYDPVKIKNIIMIGEVGNPSEQLVVTK